MMATTAKSSGSVDAEHTRVKRAAESPASASSAASTEESGEGITEAMIAEEERLEKKAHEESENERKKAQEELAHSQEQQRLSRLNFLLERSSLYTDFLYQRMKDQKQDAERKEAKRRQKQQKRKADTSSSTEKGNGASSSSSSKDGHKTRDKETYRIDSYLTEEDFEKSKDKKTGEREALVPTQGHRYEGMTEEELYERQPKLVTGGILRDYQLAGLDWLKALFENGLNGILADEMGLGKTIQTVAFFAHLYQHKVAGPYLVAAPLSTLPNWLREFHKWTPDIPTVLYHGTPEERKEKRNLIMSKDNKLNNYATVITSYEIIMKDRRFLQNLPWKYIVVDEGHRLKNLNCKLIKELKSYQSANRLLLTGTPLQNNLAELWSLLNFLLPDIFDDLDSFQRWFDLSEVHDSEGDARIIAKEQESHILSKLHYILQPFVLRRLKTDVEISIPPKRELVLYAPLTKQQQGYYKSILDKTLLDDVVKRLKGDSSDDKEATKKNAPGPAEQTRKRRKASVGKSYKERSINDLEHTSPTDEIEWVDSIEQDVINTKSEVHYSAHNMLMQLRKCCNHPYLIEYPLTPTGEYKIDEDLVMQCGKLQVLDRLLPALKREGRKVLIFSQMTRMLDIIQDYCWLRHYKFCRLDGSVGFADRMDQMKQFHDDEDTFLFLLSTRAGGLGLNLVAADTVIIYDSDWNPQMDLQAQDRCHRIGQKNPVIIYRLLTANSVDQRIFERAQAKRKLEKMVMHKGRFKGRGKDERRISPDELLELLREEEGSKVQVGHGKVLPDAELVKVLDRSFSDQDKPKRSPPKKSKAFAVIEEDKGQSGKLW